MENTLSKTQLAILISLLISILPSFMGATIQPQYSLLLPVSAAFLAIALSLTILDLKPDFLAKSKYYLYFFGLILLSLILSALIKWPIISALGLKKDLVFKLLKIISDFLVFLLVYANCSRNKLFFYAILILFLLPIILSPLAVMAPGLFRDSSAFQALRLSGWVHSISILAIFLVLPIIFLLSLLIFAKKNFIKLLSFIFSVFLFEALFWTGMRSVWLGLVFSVLLLVAFGLKYYQKNYLKNAALWLFLILAVSACGFFLLPSPIKSSFLARAVPISYVGSAQNKVLIQFHTIDDRSQIFNRGIIYFENSLIGYSPIYYELVDLKVVYPGISFYDLTAHNIFLEAALSGGLLLLLILVYFYWWAIKKILISLKKSASSLTAVLSCALLGILIVFIFNDGLFDRWLWILIALFIVAQEENIIPEFLYR